MAEAMSNMIEDEYLRVKFSTNGRKTIEQRFNIKQSLHDHIHFYEQVIQQYQQNHILS
jgi:hypothetical protein